MSFLFYLQHSLIKHCITQCHMTAPYINAGDIEWATFIRRQKQIDHLWAVNHSTATSLLLLLLLLRHWLHVLCRQSHRARPYPRLSFKHCRCIVDYMCAHFRLKWNEIAQTLNVFENRLKAGLVQHSMQTNPTAESRVKTLNSQKVRGSSPVGEERAYGGKDLPKSQV